MLHVEHNINLKQQQKPCTQTFALRVGYRYAIYKYHILSHSKALNLKIYMQSLSKKGVWQCGLHISER